MRGRIFSTNGKQPRVAAEFRTSRAGVFAIPSPSFFVKEHFYDVVDFAGVIHSQKIKSPRRIDSRARLAL
jgi:hypothetical protein